MCNNFYNENCTNGRTYNPQNRTQTNNQTNQQPAAQVQTRPVPSNQQTQTRPVTAPTTPPQTTLPSSQPVPQPAGGNIPLTDMGSSLYLGQFSGGLYANGANEPPAEHRAAGLSAAANIRPLDTNGNPSANGKIVMISVGMSNTTMEFCNSQNAASPNVPGTECNPWTFAGQASTDSRVNHSTLVIINCARGGQAAANWIDAHAHNTDNNTHNNYDLCRDNHMTPHGVTENQVQIAWVKVADPLPPASLPATNADAYTLENEIGQIVRALKVRYPHIQQVYLGSRIYSYDHTLPPRSFNGEPLAYESGFAVKWAVQAQIDQMRNGGRISDNHAGDLNYNSYPWIAWGPYFWSNGTTPRSQGTTCDPAGISWSTTDLLNDRTHPSQVGQEKVGRKLLDFFLCSPFSASWFSASGRSISPR
jgi:hypothetical protein